MICSASRCRRAASALWRRDAESSTGPISTTSRTAWPSVCSAVARRSGAFPCLSDSRSTRSSHWPASRATSCDCRASSRTSAVTASARTSCVTASNQKSPSALRTGSLTGAGSPGSRKRSSRLDGPGSRTGTGTTRREVITPSSAGASSGSSTQGTSSDSSSGTSSSGDGTTRAGDEAGIVAACGAAGVGGTGGRNAGGVAVAGAMAAATTGGGVLGR